MPEGEVRGSLVKLWLLQSFHHVGLSTVLLNLPATGGDWVIMTLICEKAFFRVDQPDLLLQCHTSSTHNTYFSYKNDTWSTPTHLSFPKTFSGPCSLSRSEMSSCQHYPVEVQYNEYYYVMQQKFLINVFFSNLLYHV